ncbi:MAG: helix-turn-helix transcriptional regulator, partial [Clostridia bacterium]|nr:helix-turn-helix transcriptional regulator [Clostridia bacterium]
IKPFVRYARFFKTEKNTDYPELFPLDARLFYVTKGESVITVMGEDVFMPTGSVLFINAGCVYKMHSKDAVFLALNFDFTQQSAIDIILPPVNTRFLKEGTKPIERVTFEDAPYFENYCFFENFQGLQTELLRLEKEFSRRLPLYKQQTSYILSMVLTAIARKCETRYSKEDKFNIERIIKYIHENLQNEIDNRAIGKTFHFHPNYISAEFKRYTGQTLHQYVLNARILKATALMESGCDVASDIAKKCGFSDANYFSRYFKKIMGVSPSAYIRSCLK